jgi:hypothetical protein
LRRRRYEGSVPRARPPDPVLRAAELSGLLVGAAALGKQYTVHLAQESVGDGKAAPDALESMLQRGDITGDLGHVVQRNTWRFLQLVEEQVGQRGLRPFYLGREHRLFANVGVEEQMRVGQQGADTVQPSQREQGAVERLAEVGIPRNRRLGR